MKVAERWEEAFGAARALLSGVVASNRALAAALADARAAHAAAEQRERGLALQLGESRGQVRF